MKKYYSYILKYHKLILFIFYIGLLSFIIYYFWKHWNCEAEFFSDNVSIEVFAGLIFSIVPLILGLNIGKKINSDLYYLKFREILSKISAERKNKKIKAKATRRLVVEVTKNFGNEITNQSWYEKIDEKLKDPENRITDCGVCGLRVEIEHEKCKFCKLNCFAWEKLD